MTNEDCWLVRLWNVSPRIGQDEAGAWCHVYLALFLSLISYCILCEQGKTKDGKEMAEKQLNELKTKIGKFEEFSKKTGVQAGVRIWLLVKKNPGHVPRTEGDNKNSIVWISNFKSLFYCFHTFGVRRSIDVKNPENQLGSGTLKEKQRILLKLSKILIQSKSPFDRGTMPWIRIWPKKSPDPNPWAGWARLQRTLGNSTGSRTVSQEQAKQMTLFGIIPQVPNQGFF